MKDQWIAWLEDNQRNFFYGIIMVVALFFIAFQLFGALHKPSRPAGRVNETFQKWLVQGEAFDKLESAIKEHPELESKFGAIIADKFIVQNEGDKAEPFAENVFQRVLRQTPEHTTFAKGSLLIAKGELQEALKQSLALKSQLDQETLLYGFNLVRIATLHRVLENSQEEKLALQELEDYMKAHEKAASVLAECFHEEDHTLFDYILERTK